MFSLNSFSFMLGLQNACKSFSRRWFSGDKYPLEPTSKQVTLHFICSMSVMKCAYLLFFSLFLRFIFGSSGHVSSNRSIVDFFSSIITMSGLRGVIQISTGTVPPVGV